MRRSIAVLAPVLVVAVLAGFAPPAFATAPVTYAPPVAGTVTDPFRPPATAYGTGNRGLTYATTPGSPAQASAPGRVTFAGQVGGALHVVVQHADGVRTSYSFLRSVSTRVGATVRAGETVGATASSFHFGARIGDAYVDPAILLESGPARVHLVPDGEFSEKGADDDGFSLLSAVRDAMSVSGSALDWARDSAGNAIGFIDGVVDAASREAALHLITILDDIVNLGQMAGPLAGFAAALADTLQAWIEDCTSSDVTQPIVTEHRIAVFVPGVGSHSSGPDDSGNLSYRFRAWDLYAVHNVKNFSYKGGRNPEAYEAKDTTGDLHDRASDLRDLLDRIARENPGVPVDLIAHSQGGLVAREALAHDYDGPNHLLPPVKHLVTVGTPHHGADLATVGEWMRWSVLGHTALAAGGMVSGFDMNGASVKQLAEDSDFIRTINNRPLREGVEYTSIGGMKDIVVPGVRARLAGATNVLVDVPSNDPRDTHSGLTEDDGARRELALALNDMPPTCQSAATTLARGLTSTGIAEIENDFGAMVAAWAAAPAA